MNIFLLDIAEIRSQLLPLTYTRPVGDIRVGILKITEKWELAFGANCLNITESYLSKKNRIDQLGSLTVINSALLPNPELVESIAILDNNQQLVKNGTFLAFKTKDLPEYNKLIPSTLEAIEYSGQIELISRPWDIFLKNGDQIRADFSVLSRGRTSEEITDPHTILYGEENIFLEEGVSIKASTLNAESGPIYLRKNSRILEGAIIRGPFALGEFSQVSMGSKIRGDSTVGPYCKIGGEVGNSVMFGYSSKGHEGYLGNSVIGEWCNIGADTNTSNLKNNYTNVKVWDYVDEKYMDSALQFCGLIMGDHSKCGINTMFNTGTVVGVSANIFGAGYPENMIPSFSWGGANGLNTYSIEKAKKTAKTVMQRRTVEWSNKDDEMFEEIFNRSSKYRTWEVK